VTILFYADKNASFLLVVLSNCNFYVAVSVRFGTKTCRINLTSRFCVSKSFHFWYKIKTMETTRSSDYLCGRCNFDFYRDNTFACKLCNMTTYAGCYDVLRDRFTSLAEITCWVCLSTEDFLLMMGGNQGRPRPHFSAVSLFKHFESITVCYIGYCNVLEWSTPLKVCCMCCYCTTAATSRQS
jgi:hypothetical protein